jgi:hypothetical protein
MLAFLLILLFLFLLAWAVVATIYLWRFARILLILENDFSEVTEALQDAEQTMGNVLDLPMFFDSPEVQRATMEALESIKAAKIPVAGMVRKFTQRSKQKYIEVVEVAREEG